LPRIFGLKSAKKLATRTDGSWWKFIATHMHWFLRHGGRERCRGAAVRRVFASFFFCAPMLLTYGAFLCIGNTHSVARPMKDAVHPRCEKEPLPPPYAPFQKRRQSQARHPTPLGRQPTIPWPRRRPPSWEATLNREQEINQEEKHRHIQAEQHSKRETVRRRPVGSKIS